MMVRAGYKLGFVGLDCYPISVTVAGWEGIKNWSLIQGLC